MLPSNALKTHLPRTSWSKIMAVALGWPAPRTKELRATAWLDGLRGVAALEVLIFHYADLWVEGDPGFGSGPVYMQFYRLPLFRTFWNSGRCMVCTFFIISGYVLTQRTLLLLRQKRVEEAFNTISSAIFRRALRLFPPALVSCAIGFVLVRAGVRGSKEDTYLPYFDSFFQQLWHFLAATYQFLNFFWWNPKSFGGDLMHKYEAVVWSVPMEFIGSMVIYVTIVGTARLTPGLRNKFIVGLALYGVAHGCWSVLCFYSGIILADLQLIDHAAKGSFFPKLPLALRNVLWSLMLVQGFWMAGAPQRGPAERGDIALGFNLQWSLMPEKIFYLDINYTGWSIAGLLMFTAISQLHLPKSFLETVFCQYLGKISFAVYLNHVWTRDILGHWLQARLVSIAGEQKPGYTIACGAWFLIMIIFNFVVAALFEKWVDAPVVRFAKKLEDRCVNGRKSVTSNTNRDLTNGNDAQELSELLPVAEHQSQSNLVHDHSNLSPSLNNEKGIV